MKRFHHGGENNNNIVYDFSVNLNPLGMPSAAFRSLYSDRKCFEQYPDTECALLRKKLSERTHCPAGQIVCGAGAADLIYRLPPALNLKKVLLAVPSFSEYERAFLSYGTEIVLLQTSPESGFALTDEFLEYGSGYDAVVVSNPVNPSGSVMEENCFRNLLQWCSRTGTALILDECFMDFVPEEKRNRFDQLCPDRPDPVIIRIRSLTKIYALAGLRIGWAVFNDAEKAEKMALCGPPWNVSGPAQKAALACLSDDTEYLRRTEERIVSERMKMMEAFRSLGLRVFESEVNYFLFEGPDTLGEALKEEGILIRDCSGDSGLCAPAGLKFYRTAVRNEKENACLLEAVKKILSAAETDISHRKKTAVLMIQGTMSNAGKSILAAGLCRVFRQDGYHPAPFKSQNMALNSYITPDGKEIGRAQAVQAEAAGIPPVSDMNPILLKPSADKGSQVIVNGEVRCSMSAADYFHYRKTLRNDVLEAYLRLSRDHDLIVIEGAGSPVEINLTRNGDDFVNMGMAALADAPVVLVGDIDRGGIFAQLGGTAALLDSQERNRIKGVIVNKFRGDPDLFREGRTMLEEVCGVPVLGVIPYTELDIDDEDSLSVRLTSGKRADRRDLWICVIRFPYISNFSDMTALNAAEGVQVNYVTRPEELADADAVILPGSKNTLEDLRWLEKTGLAEAVKDAAARGIPVTGICGGYQMLGQRVADRNGVESGYGEQEGLGLLPVLTDYEEEKVTRQTSGRTAAVPDLPEELRNLEIDGYEIHMGRSRISEGGVSAFCVLENGKEDGCVRGTVFGTYLHGLFDNGKFTEAYCRWTARRRGVDVSLKAVDYKSYREAQYNKLADVLRQNLDMDAVYKIMGL